jgi:hypothetical protein
MNFRQLILEHCFDLQHEMSMNLVEGPKIEITNEANHCEVCYPRIAKNATSAQSPKGGEFLLP